MHPIKVRRTSRSRGSVAGKSQTFHNRPRNIFLGQSDYIGAITIRHRHAGRQQPCRWRDCPSTHAVTGFSATFLTSQTGITSTTNSHPTASQITYSYNTPQVYLEQPG